MSNLNSTVNHMAYCLLLASNIPIPASVSHICIRRSGLEKRSRQDADLKVPQRSLHRFVGRGNLSTIHCKESPRKGESKMWKAGERDLRVSVRQSV